MPHPREFFDEFVLPSIAAWEANPRSVRLATIAVCQLDILAEHIINHVNPGISKSNVSLERDRLATVLPDLGFLRDVHDTHKHGRLTRKSAKIKNAQKLEVYSFGGSIGSMPIGAAPFGGTLDELAIELDDGRRFSVPVTISGCRAYWQNEMARIGI